MKNAYTGISTRATKQTEPIPGEDMIKNAAGGYGFKTSDWQMLNRFLILGTEGGTYYVGEQKLTKEMADVVLRCIKEDGTRTLDAIVDVAMNYRAYRDEPALFALAMCAGLGDTATRKYALDMVKIVCHTPTDLYHFCTYVQQFRGWGRGLRTSIANSLLVDKSLEYHAIKYQSRDGWSMADLIKLSHPKTDDKTQNALIKWILGQNTELDGLPLVQAFEQAKKATTAKEVARIVAESGLPRECVPTQFLNDPIVWEALFEKMPMTAMIRNLGKMTEVGLFVPMGAFTAEAVRRLTTPEIVQKSHLHPMQILIAHKQYGAGRGLKGGLHWSPLRELVDATDEAFYLSFGNVKPTGKRTVFALDISGSMGAAITGQPLLSCREAGAAMLLVNAAVEKTYVTTCFHTSISEVAVSPRERLGDVLSNIRKLGSGGTDISLPMAYALGKRMEVDAFCIYTDYETWAGGVHVCQHAQNYRNALNPNAKITYVLMTPERARLIHPSDTLSLELAGFDANTPSVMSDFVAGKL